MKKEDEARTISDLVHALGIFSFFILHPSAFILLSSSWAMRSNTSDQSPLRIWRKRHIVGYQGVSSRSSSQRQSGTMGNASHTGTARAPARWAVTVSHVITKSRH